jgi:hypothetical protein
MRLPRRTEVGFDAEMHLQAVFDEPAAAAPAEIGRLANLRDAEDARVETARRLLAAGRHG